MKNKFTIFLYLLVKPRIWNWGNCFSTSPIDSFPILRSKTTNPTSAHVKRKFDSFLKYAAMSTPT